MLTCQDNCILSVKSVLWVWRNGIRDFLSSWVGIDRRLWEIGFRKSRCGSFSDSYIRHQVKTSAVMSYCNLLPNGGTCGKHPIPRGQWIDGEFQASILCQKTCRDPLTTLERGASWLLFQC